MSGRRAMVSSVEGFMTGKSGRVWVRSSHS